MLLVTTVCYTVCPDHPVIVQIQINVDDVQLRSRVSEYGADAQTNFRNWIASC